MYNSVVGQAPYLHNYLLGNPVFSFLAPKVSGFARRLNSAGFIVQFARGQLERYKDKGLEEKDRVDEKQDMLARFKRYKDDEKVMSDAELLSHASSNIFAGSDTTATTLRSVIFNLCKNPDCMKKLVEEVDELDKAGKLSELVTFQEAQGMVYLHACIKEALRIHPVVGQLLERVVPKGGVEICGVHLPQGTVVGVSPWVAARERSVYGEDVEVFRPERWIEAEPSSEKLRAMERCNLGFGAGTRTCLGKHVSLFEISKLVPQLLRRFEIGLVDPGAELTVEAYWFVLQKGLICSVKQRKQDTD